MGRNVAWSDVDEMGGAAPECFAICKVDLLEEKTASTGKMMMKLEASVVEPKQYKGVKLYENFVLGSESDPQYTEPETVTGGLRRMKKFLFRLDADVPTDLEEIPEAVEGQEFLAHLIQTKNNKGRMINEISDFFRLGEREVGEINEDGSIKAAPKKKKKKKPEPAADVDEDEEEDEQVRQPRRSAPKKKKDEDEDEFDDEDDE